MQHLQWVGNILSRWIQHGFTLNADKLILATSEANFCGFQISTDSIVADPEKVCCYCKVSYSCQLHDFRAFLSPVSQLVSHLTSLLMQYPFVIWRAQGQLSCGQQTLLRHMFMSSSSSILGTFDPDLPTIYKQISPGCMALAMNFKKTMEDSSLCSAAPVSLQTICC